MTHYVIKYARNAGIIALFVGAAGLGIVSGVVFVYASDLPEISALDSYAPSTITRVTAANRQVIGEFATERRVVVGYDDIAPQLRQAIIAAEDGDFDRHFGLSIPSIAVRLMRDLVQGVEDRISGRPSSRPAGASTLTQQLARNLLPEAVGFRVGDLSLERKIKEALVAVQIEKRYTKREILTFYANHMHLGHGTYGVEAASRLYFGKSAKNVSLEEAALLAGILQSPARQSPFVNLDAAMRRRNYALQRMADEGYILQEGAGAAREADRPARPAAAAPVSRAVLPRRSQKAPRVALRRQAALRKRTRGDHDAGRRTAGGGESRGGSRSSPARQTPGLPPSEAERAGRRALVRRLYRRP